MGEELAVCDGCGKSLVKTFINDNDQIACSNCKKEVLDIKDKKTGLNVCDACCKPLKEIRELGIIRYNWEFKFGEYKRTVGSSTGERTGDFECECGNEIPFNPLKKKVKVKQ